MEKDLGYDLTNEYEALSVDNILAEYQAEEESLAQREREERFRAYLDSVHMELSQEEKPAKEEVDVLAYTIEEEGPRDEEGVRLYAPTGRIARMQQEALNLRLDEEEAPCDADGAPEHVQEPEEEAFHRDFYMGEEHTDIGSDYEAAALDLSPEEDYQPPVYGGKAGDEGLAGTGKKKKRLGPGKGKKKKRALNVPASEQEQYEYNEGFEDLYTAPAAYAPERDYDFAEPDAEGIREEDTFPSFREYVLGLLFGLLFRLRRLGFGEGRVLEDVNEELGPEMSPMAASKYYGSYVHAMRLRVRIAAVLLLFMLWFSVGLGLPGALKMMQVRAAMLMGLQLTILLLGLDSLTTAILNIARRRFGADSLAVIACLVSSIDALGLAKDLFGRAHVPLCLLSSLAFVGVMVSALLSARSLRKAMRVPAIGKQCFAVTGELGIKGKSTDITLLKSVRSSKGFVRRAEEMPPDEELFLKASPFLLLFSLLFAMIASAVNGNFACFMESFSAVLSAAVPLTALLGFALPYFVGTNRIFHSGAAIAGWSGVCDIGQSKNMIVTDRDIFPESAVEVENIRVFADEKPQRIIAYAGTMITASGSSISACFGKLMEKHKCSMCQVADFQYLSGGGMKGIIDGHVVLCGSTDLMRLMNVKLPFRLVGKNSVLLSIDGILYGIFTMKYEARPQVRHALVGLMKSNRHPIFAIRDFNINPEMIRQSFDIPTDGYDFPPFVERFAMTESTPGDESNIAGVVCLEGLGPLTCLADTGRSIYVASRINVYLSLLAAIVGLILVFAKLLVSGSIGIGFLLAFALLWAAPVVVISLFLHF